MEIAPDQIAAHDAQLPSAVLRFDPFGELFNGELALSEIMLALPIWTLEEVGYTYDALHVHPNGQIKTGSYPPEYYEYDDLRACTWDEGLEAIESFDWSGTERSEQIQDVQSTGILTTDASVRLGVRLFDINTDESNVQQESFRANEQPENKQLASFTLVPALEGAKTPSAAPSSQPWIPSPPSASPQQVHRTLPSPGYGNEVEAEGTFTDVIPSPTDSPASGEAIDNQTEQNQHVATVTGTQSVEQVAVIRESNIEDIASTTSSHDSHLEGVSSAKGIAPGRSIWDGVMSRRDTDSMTVFPRPQPQYFPSPRQTIAPPTEFNAHRTMFSLVAASTPYYNQPFVQPTTQHVPTGIVRGNESVHKHAVENRRSLRHDLVARSHPTLPGISGNTNGGNEIGNSSLAQVPTDTLSRSVPDQRVPPSITINNHTGEQLRNQLEVAAGNTPTCTPSAPMPAEFHKHSDTLRQDSIVGPLAAGLTYPQPSIPTAFSEQQPLVNLELPPLPFRNSISPLNSFDSHNVPNANVLQEQKIDEKAQQSMATAEEQEFGQQTSMQTSIDLDIAPPPTSTKDLSPSPITIDENASAKTTQSPPASPATKSLATNTRKRSKAPKKPDDISSTEESAPAKKKPKKVPRARSRASTAAKKSTVLPEEDVNAAVEQAQPSTSKSVKKELAENEQPKFRVPNYTPQPARTSATILERGIGNQLSFASSPGFHQARSEDTGVQEGHFSDVERSVSPTQQPVLDRSKKPRGSLSRELRSLQGDTQSAKGAVETNGAVVPGPHLALHLQLPERRAEKASVEKPAETSTILPASIIVEDDVDADEDEILVTASPSPRPSLIPKKRARPTKPTTSAPKKPVTSRRKASKASRPTPPAIEDEIEGEADDSDEDNLFRKPKVSGPSPPPTTPAKLPPLKFRKAAAAVPKSTHPLDPSYGKRTTRGDSRVAKAESTNSVVDEHVEDGGEDGAYSERESEGAESEVSDAQVTKKQKLCTTARKPVKQGKQQKKVQSARVATSRVSMLVAPSTPRRNKFGFKESPARAAAAKKEKAQPKKTTKKTANKGAVAAAAAAEGVNGSEPRQTRRASMVASELREAEEKARNVKLRLRKKGGAEEGK